MRVGDTGVSYPCIEKKISAKKGVQKSKKYFNCFLYFKLLPQSVSWFLL